MGKRSIVVLLVGVNVVLLTVLIVTAWDLPKANAQAAPLASNYVMVAGVVQSDHDALYIIDLSARTMHVFDIDRTNRNFNLLDMRDLRRDFRAEERAGGRP